MRYKLPLRKNIQGPTCNANAVQGDELHTSYPDYYGRLATKACFDAIAAQGKGNP